MIKTVRFLLLLLLLNAPVLAQSVEEVLDRVATRFNPQANLEDLSALLSRIGPENDSIKALFYFEMGKSYGMTYRLDSAGFYMESSLKYAQRAQDTIGWIMALNGLGNVSNMKNNSERAYGYFDEALLLASAGKRPQIKGWQGKLLGSIAGIFYVQGDVQSALDYAARAYQISSSFKDSLTMVTNLNQMGYCLKSLNRLDEALVKNQLAQAILEKTRDTLQLMYQYYNIGGIYAQIGETGQAISYLQQAHDLSGHFEEFEIQAATLNELSQIAIDQKKYQQAMDLAGKAYQIASENHVLVHVKNAKEKFYRIHLALGNYREAVAELEGFQLLKDSIEQEETRARIDEFKVRYETAEKELAIEELNYRNELAEAQLRQERTVQMALAILLLAVIVFAAILYFNQRQKIQLKTRAMLGEISDLRADIKDLMLGTYDGKVCIDADKLNRGLVNPLSLREIEVLEMIFTQKSNTEISEAMEVSINTVKTHLKNIYSKLGVSNRTEALEKVMVSSK